MANRTRAEVEAWLNGPGSKEDRGQIVLLYKGRCVECGRKATDVHEMIPRSQGAKAWQRRNRRPLCRACHTDLQANTRSHIARLTVKMNRILTALYGKIE